MVSAQTVRTLEGGVLRACRLFLQAERRRPMTCFMLGFLSVILSPLPGVGILFALVAAHFYSEGKRAKPSAFQTAGMLMAKLGLVLNVILTICVMGGI